MARYTEYVYEILQKAAQPGEDIENLADMTAMSERTLFLNAPLNVLSPAARANIVTQFTIHYLGDELGMIPLSYWRTRLADKIINNAATIDFIYANLLKQYYSEFEHKSGTTHGTRQTVESGTENTTTNDDTTASDSKTRTDNLTERSSATSDTTETRGNTRTLNTTDNTNETIQRDLTKTGTETTELQEDKLQTNALSNAQTGTITDQETLNTQEQTTHNTTDTTTYNTTDTRTDNLSEVTTGNNIVNSLYNKIEETDNRKHYTTESEKEIAGGYKDTNDSRNDSNDVNTAFDTPQGSLQQLITPGGAPGGNDGTDLTKRGVAYAAAQTYNYMSAAQTKDATEWNKSTAERVYGISGNNDGKYTETTSDTFDIDGTTNYDKAKTTTTSGQNTASIAGTSYNGDVQNTNKDETKLNTGTLTNAKTGTEQDALTGTETTANTGTNTTQRTLNTSTADTGTITHADTGSKEITYDTADSDDTTRHNELTKTGTIGDSGTVTGRATDDGTRINTGTQTTAGTASTERDVTSEKTTSTSGTATDEGTETWERYKIEFTQLLFDNNLMEKLWDIFDDLFMMIY